MGVPLLMIRKVVFEGLPVNELRTEEAQSDTTFEVLFVANSTMFPVDDRTEHDGYIEQGENELRQAG